MTLLSWNSPACSVSCVSCFAFAAFSLVQTAFVCAIAPRLLAIASCVPCPCRVRDFVAAKTFATLIADMKETPVRL